MFIGINCQYVVKEFLGQWFTFFRRLLPPIKGFFAGNLFVRFPPVDFVYEQDSVYDLLLDLRLFVQWPPHWTASRSNCRNHHIPGMLRYTGWGLVDVPAFPRLRCERLLAMSADFPLFQFLGSLFVF